MLTATTVPRISEAGVKTRRRLSITYLVNHARVVRMAFDSDSLNRRTLGPAIASAVLGIALGVVAVIGASMVDSSPQGTHISSNDALLGDPEYGSRN
ncbi:hypothetical protein FRC0474_02367 [Corynebacterium diphtheriae]|nr:hypothetical protein FRC0474_02367 [Corynebacterium diphtheriae]